MDVEQRVMDRLHTEALIEHQRLREVTDAAALCIARCKAKHGALNIIDVSFCKLSHEE